MNILFGILQKLPKTYTLCTIAYNESSHTHTMNRPIFKCIETRCVKLLVVILVFGTNCCFSSGKRNRVTIQRRKNTKYVCVCGDFRCKNLNAQKAKRSAFQPLAHGASAKCSKTFKLNAMSSTTTTATTTATTTTMPAYANGQVTASIAYRHTLQLLQPHIIID